MLFANLLIFTQVSFDRSSSVCVNAGANGDAAGVAMSRSCDCLTQTDISAVLTPKNEFPASASASAIGLPFPFFQLKRVDIPLDSSGDSDAANSASFPAIQQQQQQQQQQQVRRDRSRSPRPQTLPGLVRDGEAEDEAAAVMKIPGLKQLAGTALINSPLAPQPVKAYAKNLVEGLILDTITKQVPLEF